MTDKNVKFTCQKCGRSKYVAEYTNEILMRKITNMECLNCDKPLNTYKEYADWILSGLAIYKN